MAEINQKYSEAKPPTDLEAAEINRKYDVAKLEIDKLKAKIQSLRKQKSSIHNKVLTSEYEKYIALEKSRDTESEHKSDDNDTSSNNNNNNNNNNNDEDSNNNSKTKQLHKLQCKLSEYKKLSGHGNKVYSVDWNPLPTSSELVSVGRDGKLIFWNAESGYKRLAYPLDTEFIMTLKYSPTAKYVACGGLDDILSIFPVREDETGICKDIEPQIYKSHTGYISCIQYIDNNTILTASGDATIREWDINKSQQSQPKYTYKIHREDVMSISVNPQNPSLLLTGSVDSTAKIIDFRERAHNINDNESKTNNSSYNGQNIITHSFYMGYEQDLSKKNRTTDVNVVKWFPDGRSFVAGCDDGTVRLFDIRSGRILNEYSYHKNYLHRDSMNGANSSNSHDSIVKTSTNTPIHNESKDNNDDEHKSHEPLKASDMDDPYDTFDDDIDPTDGVATLDFSRSGAFMFVSYNNDQHKVLAWNMLTGDVIQELKHDGHVPCLVVSPDGTRIVTACWDHHLKLWQ